VAVPYKVTTCCFGPFVVLKAKGAQVALDLTATFGKAHQRVNIRRLKFFEARDAQSGTADQPLHPLPGVNRSDKNEVSRICASCILKGDMNSTLSGKAMTNPTIVGCSGKSSLKTFRTCWRPMKRNQLT